MLVKGSQPTRASLRGGDLIKPVLADLAGHAKG
jgi:hypothetical protein